LPFCAGKWLAMGLEVTTSIVHNVIPKAITLAFISNPSSIDIADRYSQVLYSYY
jgi:hypothetical protein